MKCEKCGFELGNDAKFCPKCGFKVTAPPAVQAPAPVVISHDISNVWPEWQLETLLGKGAYGSVYKAVRRDNNLESHAAIKIITIPSNPSEIDSLRAEGLNDDDIKKYFKGIVEEFVSEISLMESLKGIQNIVSVEDYKVIEKTDSIGCDIYIRMELLIPFNTYIRNKTLTESEIIKLGGDICSALEICGKRNIIHRDIKPENIFVNDFGHFKLGDFGIARKLENSTSGLSQKGTFNYMAPEVATSCDYDTRVDTYSLGLVLYRLLNENRLPFLFNEDQASNPNDRKAAVERRIHGENLPKPCNASEQMSALILRACSHNPEDRFTSPTEMKEALALVAVGNYTPAEDDLNKTRQVRGARTAVAPNDNGNQVGTFGKKSKKKGKAKGIIILCIILALLIGLGSLFITSPAYSVYNSLNKENYSDAVSDYDDEVKKNFIQELILDLLLKNRPEKVLEKYKDDKIDFETAIAELEALQEMGIKGAEDKIAEVTAEHEAADALLNGDDLYNKGDIAGAIGEYNKIPEGNEHYAEAQQKLAKAYGEYLTSVIKTAKAHIESKEYKYAVQVINTAYGILPDSIDTTELDTLKTSCLASYKTEVNTDVENYVAEGKWSEAFALISEAITFDDNEYFQTLKKSTESKYVKEVTDNVNNHMNHNRFNAAKALVDTALTILPENADLLALQQKVADKTPTFLSQLYLIDSNQYTRLTGIVEDSFGNNYNGGHSLNCGDYDTGYAIFNLNKEHKTVQFSAIAFTDTNSYRKFKIAILVDDELVTTVSNFTKTSGKKDITVNVENATKLEIQVTADIETWTTSGMSIGFVDPS